MHTSRSGQTSLMHVYLFGAGASAAEGAPSTDEFLARAWVLLGPAFPEPALRVWRFLEELFGVPLRDAADFARVPAVDQVFSLVDWSLQADQGLGPAYDPPRLRQVRRDLEQLLSSTLRAALPGWGPGAGLGSGLGARAGGLPEGAHARFARELLASRPPGGFALISLNYDTLLDGALEAAGARPDYGFRAPDLPGDAPRPLLAKLHGSLNWGRCPACDRVEVGSVWQSAADLVCTRCGNTALHALIVSPTWLKAGLGSQVRHLWDLALEAVQQAERIVFVGYSMPPADVAVYQLLRRGLLTRRRAGSPLIEVVNRGGPARTLKEQHFLRLFGSGVQFDFTGFRGQT